MSDLAAKIAAQREQNASKTPKKASEILRGHKDVSANMAVYLPKSMIRDLKKLAFEEDTSVSKIAEELFAERLKEGPRKPEPQNRRRVID
ncbi:Arc-like repressor [Mycobacterium phage EagleEye]|uniref:ParB-like dsDNA partitioning protein n=1 Tax=Mycobacterium phage EagleEye TaxID=1429759 RepID=W0LMQ0_9CAUD|nr:Arc-like repressor [Mycobacterium phage EagleEye]AHG23819.1 ParB-like dsDNA partitioning protein [Mycobacterium phage EagleEye]QDK03472.1 ParB-like dsDNA partitioning protein [Mycobacterium phage Lucyedi]